VTRSEHLIRNRQRQPPQPSDRATRTEPL